MRQEHERKGFKPSQHYVPPMISICSTRTEFSQTNTSSMDKINNSYKIRMKTHKDLGLCDCMGTRSLTYYPSIINPNNYIGKTTRTSAYMV